MSFKPQSPQSFPTDAIKRDKVWQDPCILPFKTDAFDCQYIPFWTGYNSSTSDYRPEFSVVSYAPIVDAKPNDIATVYTTRTHKSSDELRQLRFRSH
jgi:hypothetical protein